MLESGRELLQKAIRARSIAVLTTSAPDSGERLIVRLAATGGSADARLITAGLEEGRGALIDQLIASATPLCARIKVGEWVAITFQTTLVSQQGRLFGRKVVLRHPKQVSVEQRRRAPRERVPQEVRIQARFVFQKRPGSGPITSDVWDVSETGICLWCRAADLPTTLQTDEPIDLTLGYNGKEHVLAARFRHRRPMENGGVRVGLHFSAQADTSPAPSEAIRAIIEVLSQLRIRRESEKFVTRTLGLAS
jgi:hypothetical protein